MSDSSVAKSAESMFGNIFDILETVVLSACFVLLLFTFVGRPAKVDGSSMLKTLYNGDLLVISNLAGKPERGDIIVFQKISSGHPKPMVKRVIATEGETIDINFDTWRVTVTDADGNATILDEGEYRYLATDARVTSNLSFPLTVGEGQYFVMGDNRNHSLDSRSSSIGLVNKNEIIGKALFRLYPLNKIGTLN